MTNNPQLAPSVIVDRNGKTTTVYKKPNKPVRASAFTKPVLPAAKPTDKMTGEEIAYTIIRRLKNNVPPDGYPKVRILPEIRYALLAAATDRDHIKRVHTIFETLMAGTKTEHFQAIHTIVTDFYFQDPVHVKVLHSCLDYVMEHPVHLENIATFGRALVVKTGVIDPDSDNAFASLSAHIAAKRHHMKLHAANHGYYSGHENAEYLNNPNYVAAVERHYDKLDHLFAYRELRGVNEDTFDEQDFQAYLQHGAVANGWL